MTNYFKIIRWQNLLFIVLIQFLIQFAVVSPILQTYYIVPQNFLPDFILMVLATIFIAAGGYVINDYFDVKIDRINKPDKVIVAETITKENAMRYYQVLTGIGLFTGLALALMLHSFTLGFVFIVIPGLLWFYSAAYKRQFLWGNLIVSFLAAITIFIVGIVIVTDLKKEFGDLLYQTNIPMVLYLWTGGFGAFAFLVTWIREIIKDMEDEKGDREMECRTMPIKIGITKTKWVIYLLIALTIAALLHYNFKMSPFDGNITLRYIIVGLIVPFIILAFLVFKAKMPKEFKQASALSKYIMLIGILYTLLFYYLEAKKFHLPFFGLFIIQ